MQIQQLMTTDLKTCNPDQTLDAAARVMWECDCGVVPVVANDRVVGMITDRDICMAAYTQNRLLTQIRISTIGMKPVITVRPDDTLASAESLMQRHQVRRLAVVDASGRLVGIVSMGDLARVAGRNPRNVQSDEITRTLAAISEPRAGTRGESRAHT
jgi:CBS domain-containing protein